MPEKIKYDIDELLDKRQYAKLKDILGHMNEADIVELFETLYGDNFDEEREFLILYRLLPKNLAAEVFSFMNHDMQEHLINAFTDKELREILSKSFIDDTVDLVEEMPANVVARILRNSSTGARRAINDILKYPKDSAGSIMTIEYVNIHKDMTVIEAFDKIRRVGLNKETIYTCYVTENRRLIGFVTVKDLFMAEESDIIGDIMETNIICAETNEDREKVAAMFRKYDFLAIPVVDTDYRLVGIVTFDDAMDVIQDENTEDVSKMYAMTPMEDSYFRTGILRHAGNRIIWLLILMVSMTITGVITMNYENAFAAVPLLVSFMPMIMDTGGNCSSQSSTLIIRGMALDEIRFSDFFKVVFKEFRISLIISAVLALINGVRIYLMYGHSLALSATIAVSIIATVVMSKLIGAALPMLAKKCRLDPAIMAAPLLATIVDLCSIVLYFNIASAILNL
ncbi:MAG: magnesium transporter [Firmicutes bacterium]|nr:magnesium transporter [Bacillota bacterium]